MVMISTVPPGVPGLGHLAENGPMQPGLLFESTFTDSNLQGPENVFGSEQVGDLVLILDHVRSTHRSRGRNRGGSGGDARAC